MTLNKFAVPATAALCLALGACAQKEEPAPVVDNRTPIYAKDGTIVRYENQVYNSNGTPADIEIPGEQED